VLGHNVASEYDLTLWGPVAKNHGNDRSGGVSPSPSPSPEPAASPAPGG
jgi:hypothetical protein